ncbi:hypothetical protein KB236_00300 [Levilactobacillus brevis]|nr:hypothetical protein KB236_00300 [Levilactobacillus brevis]
MSRLDNGDLETPTFGGFKSSPETVSQAQDVLPTAIQLILGERQGGQFIPRC